MKPRITDKATLKKIYRLCLSQLTVIFTGRATRDIGKLGVSSDDVLLGIRNHLDTNQDVFLTIQKTTGLPAYEMLMPFRGIMCYVKVQFDTNSTGEIIVVISTHP